MVVGNELQVRLYDVRTDSIQRRPVAYTSPGLLEQRVTCFCQTGEHELVVADTAGYVVSVDLRNLPSTGHARYVGPAGSVRQLAAHSKLPRMAAVGLDRMLRLYDTTTRRQVACLYLKQRLNCVLMEEEEGDLTEGEVDPGEGDAEIDRGGFNQEDDVCDYVDSDHEDLSRDSSKDNAEGSQDDESSTSGGSQTSSSDEEVDDESGESAEDSYAERRNKRRKK
jgi:ribosome biogenesis protein NSA1